jgi:hypothetical protein
MILLFQINNLYSKNFQAHQNFYPTHGFHL